MKFLKTVFWSILTVVALYYAVEAAVVFIGHYHKQIGNNKEKKSDNYKSYGTIYKSSKEKISNIQSEYNEKLREELSQ